jgi:type IV secretion system protein VirD4
VAPESTGQHWTNGAKELAVGLTLYMRLTKDRAATLADVRDVITLNETDFKACMAEMVRHPFAPIRDKLNTFTELNNEKRAFISALKTQTEWLSDPVMRACVSRHDFSFADLKRKPMTVFIILPAEFVSAASSYSRFLRLTVQAVINAITATPRLHPRPVWMLLDEFPALGKMDSIETMMALGRGYGLQLQPVVQNLGQLKELYRGNWETFVSNATVKQFFAPADMMTADYLSRMLGQYTAATLGGSTSNNQSSQSWGQTGRPLLRPEECMQLGPHQQIVFGANVPGPMLMGRWPYYKTDRLAGRFNPDPYVM